MSKSPVFIVGSPRSGTSILVDAMLSVGYEGFREGNFLTLMTRLEFIIDNHFKAFGGNPKVLAGSIDPQVLKTKLEFAFKELTDLMNPGPLWFDKTGNPEMIEAIPVIRQLWPESVFIFAKRRAIENVVSRLKKFPGHSFEYHCQDWARNMAAWRCIRDQIPSEIYVEVDQQELIRDAKAASIKLSKFLELAGGLERNLNCTFTSNRPQETADGTAARVLSLDRLSWSETQLAIFDKYCAPEMRAYGYSTEESYYQSATR